MVDYLAEISSNIYKGEFEIVNELIKQALEQGVSANEILTKGLMAGMDRVGKDFKCGDLFVPEVIASAKAMHNGMDQIKPFLIEGTSTSAGTYVIGTVKGDLHDIGKSLVKLMMEGAGFKGIDLGTDVSTETFIESVRLSKPDILAMSALLTTTMVEMGVTIRALEAAHLRDKVKVIIGGAPVTLAFTEYIGADGYAPDAARAVDVVRNLIAGEETL